jgi:hypothetical protein
VSDREEEAQAGVLNEQDVEEYAASLLYIWKDENSVDAAIDALRAGNAMRVEDFQAFLELKSQRPSSVR